MKKIKIFLLGLLTSTLLINCDKDKNNSEECTLTAVRRADPWRWELADQVNSTVEYFNNSGFLTRVETKFFESSYNYYETYKYDPENKLLEYFISCLGYSKYLYDEGKRVKKEIYNLDMVITGYYTYEYSDNIIIDQKKYTSEGLDTAINYYYYDGHLDSIVTILPNELKTLYDKMYYKYDSKGNNIECLRYSNLESENLELFQSYLYSYDDNSNLIKYEFRNKNGELEYGTYLKYEYNDIGNLTKTKIFNSSDNQIDSLLLYYQYCKEIKLIRPEH